MSIRLAASVLLLSPVLVLPSVAGTSPADAAGTTCTIVGTSGPDRLVGTNRRDVICGRGGGDTLLGRDGDDVLIGGRGHDQLVGGDGDDLLDGGTRGDDLNGGPGDDELAGGRQGDRMLGGDGSDVVAGGQGDDELDGGPLADDVDGGGGFNTCVVDPDDLVERCSHDTDAPVLLEAVPDVDVVDVTESDASFVVRVHATDDFAVTAVYLNGESIGFPGAIAQRVSGTAMDGWWEATVTLRRYSKPGTYSPVVRLYDRFGHRTEVTSAFAVTVLDENPDTTPPVVTHLAAPAPDAVFDPDADGYDGVPIRVRVTDDLSGVSEVVYWATVFLPNGDHQSFSTNLTRTSGTALDGVWEGKAWLSDAYAGTYSLMFFVIDKTSQETYEYEHYAGPTSHERLTYYPSHPIPGGRGDFTFLGKEMTDTTRPQILDATAAPAEVSTLHRPAEVSFTAHVVDAGIGVESVRVRLRNHDLPSLYLGVSMRLTSGNRNDGTWTGTITIPQGSPPGRYWVTVNAFDFDTNYTGREGEVLPSQPTVVVVDDSP